MSYNLECQVGRDHAAQLMREVGESGNLPKIVQALREAAKDETGYGVGFLYALSEKIKHTSS